MESDAEFLDYMERWTRGAMTDTAHARLFALARRGAAVQWRPIEEAPKDGSFFVGLMSDRHIRKAGVDIVHWIDDPVWPIEGYGTGYQIEFFSHFLPLPPPPQETSDD